MYSVDLPAAENKSAQCRASVFLATLTTTSRYSGKFFISSHVFSKSDSLLFAYLAAVFWFLFTFCLQSKRKVQCKSEYYNLGHNYVIDFIKDTVTWSLEIEQNWIPSGSALVNKKDLRCFLFYFLYFQNLFKKVLPHVISICSFNRSEPTCAHHNYDYTHKRTI